MALGRGVPHRRNARAVRRRSGAAGQDFDRQGWPRPAAGDRDGRRRQPDTRTRTSGAAEGRLTVGGRNAQSQRQARYGDLGRLNQAAQPSCSRRSRSRAGDAGRRSVHEELDASTASCGPRPRRTANDGRHCRDVTAELKGHDQPLFDTRRDVARASMIADVSDDGFMIIADAAVRVRTCSAASARSRAPSDRSVDPQIPARRVHGLSRTRTSRRISKMIRDHLATGRRPMSKIVDLP